MHANSVRIIRSDFFFIIMKTLMRPVYAYARRNILVFHNKSCHLYTFACIQYACGVHIVMYFTTSEKEQ